MIAGVELRLQSVRGCAASWTLDVMSVLAQAATDELPDRGRDAQVAVGGAKPLFIRLAPKTHQLHQFMPSVEFAKVLHYLVNPLRNHVA
jgi:hypothetical protein